MSIGREPGEPPLSRYSVLLFAIARENKVRGMSEWLTGWEDMMDIIVIAGIAAVILMTLFAAFLVDGLEEYFRRSKTRVFVRDENPLEHRLRVGRLTRHRNAQPGGNILGKRI